MQISVRGYELQAAFLFNLHCLWYHENSLLTDDATRLTVSGKKVMNSLLKLKTRGKTRVLRNPMNNFFSENNFSSIKQKGKMTDMKTI